MDLRKLAMTAVLCLGVLACEAKQTAAKHSNVPSRAAHPAPQAAEGRPASTPPPLTPEAERTGKGARNILLFFARSIETGRFDDAWAMLDSEDQKKWSAAAFAAMFSGLTNVIVAVPSGTMEGAAGTAYYTALVTVTGDDAEGRPVRFEGEAVLARVNDVDGASPESLRWHFRSLVLEWTH